MKLNLLPLWIVDTVCVTDVYVYSGFNMEINAISKQQVCKVGGSVV